MKWENNDNKKEGEMLKDIIGKNGIGGSGGYKINGVGGI